MCGIAGYIGDQELSPTVIAQCLQQMRRRGPDHAAYRNWKNTAGKNVYFLHSRLSIIDLDPRAHQPFHVGSRWLTYNGEIYNYVEVRRELEQAGEKFTTSSDTEVLIRAINKFGWDVMDRLEGMWAFAVYDEKDGSVTFCRDRFGEKPLYFYKDETGVYFGSEVKFIQQLLGKKMDVNMNQVYRYLVNGYKSLYKKDETFFKNLHSLPPSSILRINADLSERKTAYWRPAIKQDEAMSFDDAVNGAREKLIQSVKLRLRADVPLAFCMSGGVDSNALISIAKRKFNYDVHGFTIVNTDARYEEQEMVEHGVSQLGIRHTPIKVNTSDFLGKLRTLVKQHDAPVYTITYFAHWLLMESIAEHGYRISISGTAADELFTGYFDHHLAYLYDVRQDKALHATAKQAWSEKIKPIVRNPFLSNPDLFINDSLFRGHIFLNAEGFSRCLKTPWFEPFQEERFTDSLLRNRMLNEMFHEAVPVILHEDDLNAMYFSIENRSPFLDRNLFEFCNSIPTRHLIREGRAKTVLREAMRGIVPDKILDNPRKVGFNAPIFSFLDVKDSVVRGYLLDDSPIFKYVHRDKIENLIDKESLPNSESKFLFYFITTKMFLEEFDS